MKILRSRYLQLAIFILVVGGLLTLAISGYLSPIFGTVLDPLVSVQRWISIRYQALYEFITVPRDLATLRQRNAELENQVSQLQNQVIALQQQLSEAQILYALLNYARSKPENIYIACAVIGRDPSPFLHYVIIDHGSDSVIRHGMPVVTQQGLVGRIEAVTAGAARVQLITDASSVVNVRLKSTQTEALLNGSVTGDINLGMLPQDVDLKQGELVLTSGLGGNYPPDVLVGEIVTVRKRETDLFQTASIQPMVDFANLNAVLIISNFKPIEIAPLIPPQAP